LQWFRALHPVDRLEPLRIRHRNGVLGERSTGLPGGVAQRPERKFGLNCPKAAQLPGEKIELERARATVPRNDRRPHFFLGCDIHAYFQMDVALFLSRFTTVLTPLAGTADPRI
jgi:hypothetical protein